MKTATQVRQSETAVASMGSRDDSLAGRCSADPDAIRSENNILAWMAYLPNDCIKRMIELKWDLTT